MARLQDHRGRGAECGIDQQPPDPRHGVARKVQPVAERLEPALHVEDAEKQKTRPGQHIAEAPHRTRLLEHQHDGEGDHRHGIVRDIDPQSKCRHKPRPRGRAEIGAEDDPDPAISEISPALRKEIVRTETRELDWTSVLDTRPKASARGVERVAAPSRRSRLPPLSSLKPSCSMRMPKRKMATPAATSCRSGLNQNARTRAASGRMTE